MADLTTITSANSVFTITVAGLFVSPVQLQGYASDSAVVTEPVDQAEIQMGVDGVLAGGYVPMPTPQTIKLLANSPSRAIFSSIAQASRTARDIFYLQGELSLPSFGSKFTLNKGVITNLKQIPDLLKVLSPVDIKVVWESVLESPN